MAVTCARCVLPAGGWIQREGMRFSSLLSGGSRAVRRWDEGVGQAELPGPRPAGFPGGVCAAHPVEGLASDSLLRLVLEQGPGNAPQLGAKQSPHLAKEGLGPEERQVPP